eukprot:CAMPEP_0203756230 /NCGR_PEP_ID=MMETSP0098-20131031/9537_1 /ASSEMBLY_ACC=CAM_ASM_000208 /TAXON_ID=96639 /ORGANISM=" , Strain NY0313808BC1" /LENGTH=210 /DNA_ID=CAMNT_0050648015 /DNA_START=168 /DNA_END=796 /DNA_ORIENTATION=+
MILYIFLVLITVHVKVNEAVLTAQQASYPQDLISTFRMMDELETTQHTASFTMAPHTEEDHANLLNNLHDDGQSMNVVPLPELQKAWKDGLSLQDGIRRFSNCALDNPIDAPGKPCSTACSFTEKYRCHFGYAPLTPEFINLLENDSSLDVIRLGVSQLIDPGEKLYKKGDTCRGKDFSLKECSDASACVKMQMPPGSTNYEPSNKTCPT